MSKFETLGLWVGMGDDNSVRYASGRVHFFITERFPLRVPRPVVSHQEHHSRFVRISTDNGTSQQPSLQLHSDHSPNRDTSRTLNSPDGVITPIHRESDTLREGPTPLEKV